MKLIINKVSSEFFPKELLVPNFYTDKLDSSTFINTEIINIDEPIISASLFFNKINFFIGSNNSGKSRFMRGLLKVPSEPYEYVCDEQFFLDLLKELREVNISPKENEVLEKYNLNIKTVINTIPNEKRGMVNYNKGINDSLNSNISRIEEENLSPNILIYIDKLKKIIKELNYAKQNRIKQKNYIPVLRSLLKNKYLGSGIFESTIKEVFFEDKSFPHHINVYTGLDLWDKLNAMQGTPERENIERFSNFLSTHFFENKKVKLLANNKEPKLISLAIENNGVFEYRDINDIGDGIQTLLLLLFPIFSASRNECFYIEEPETNLHPSYQRIFIETLLNNEFLKQKRLKYFFTTHSNHFLDLTLRSDEVSFFQFQKSEENKHLIKTCIKPDKETLDLLGVNNTSVFLANTSLWVEGPTDRKYLSKFLKLYCGFYKKPYLKEDIDFAFFEYGGNLITHYLFDEEEKFDDEEVKEKINSFALSNKIYLIADSDNAKEGGEKFRRRKILEDLSSEKGNFKYQNTIVKEIENLLPVKVLHDFIPKLLTDEISINKAKKINFKRSDYKGLGLGEFYKTQFLSEGIPEENIKKFKAESGTLRNEYKNKLAGFVVGSNYKYSDLIKDNEELDNLVGTLYDFIKS